MKWKYYHERTMHDIAIQYMRVDKNQGFRYLDPLTIERMVVDTPN